MAEPTPEADPSPPDEANDTASLFAPRKLILQSIFWLIGLGLLGWIIYRAIETGDWGKIARADPRLVAVLVGCTVISSMINGATFWIVIQPIRRVRFTDMQILNLVGNMLNYAPIRAGAIARILYHHRVDRLGLLQIGAWFGFIAYILALGVGSALVATLLYDHFDLIWITIVVVQMVLGGLAIQLIVGHPVIVKHGRGIDRIARDARALWGAIALRLADIGAFTGRMWAAMVMLGIHLPATYVVVLAMVALAASLIPFGRVGFREFCVAIAAARLGETVDAVDLPWEQLALIESAGEAIVFLPLGMLGLIWYRKRWREASKRPNVETPKRPGHTP